MNHRGRFLLVVLDGFGIGEMPDTKKVCPRDTGANTCKHILGHFPAAKLPVLEQLGLMNAAGFETAGMKKSNTALYGEAELMHEGADTFLGHQEIMGTRPKKPFKQPIEWILDLIAEKLSYQGHHARFIHGDQGRLLLVDGAVGIGDNLETEPGQNYNVIGALNAVSFQTTLAIGKVVRNVAKVNRVIVFGGAVGPENLLAAIEEKPGGIMGINAPASGVYRNQYQCLHLGYGIDEKVQLPMNLHRVGISTTLIGKVADVVQNPFGKSLPCVDTAEAMKLTLKEMSLVQSGFICTNVQETDLAGHQQDIAGYWNKLTIADQYLGEMIGAMAPDDLLVVMADHGNDPTAGHSQHTREMVPVLIHNPSISLGAPCYLGRRKTLSDAGATVAEYFGASGMEQGSSFLKRIYRSDKVSI